jgi:PAS domain S-box-containing protein
MKMISMKISVNKFLSAGIAVIILAIICILLISLKQLRKTQDTSETVITTQSSLFQNQDIIVSVLDNETGARGYLITGKENYLEPLTKSEKEIADKLSLLHSIIPEDAILSSLFDSLAFYIQKRIDFSRRMVQVRKEKGIDTASKLVLTGEGKYYTDRIRGFGTLMEKREAAIFQDRKKNNNQAISTLNRILYGVLIASFLLGIVIFQRINSDFQRHKINEQKFKALLNAAPDATIVVNDSGLIQMVNKQVENLFDYTQQELINQPVELLMPAEARSRHMDHRKGFIKEARVRSMGEGMELNAVKKNGSKFPVEISLSPIQSDQGLLVSASVRDISARKQQEEKLKRSEERFHLLVSSIHDYAIFMLDVDGKVVSWNKGARNIKGYTAEEIIGKSIDVFYTAEDNKAGLPQSNLAFAKEHGHYETEGWRVRKDGSVFYADVVFNVMMDQQGKIYGYAKVTRDITEKRRAEDRIRFLALIADNIQDPVISADNNFKVTNWNLSAEKLFGWKSDEAMGKEFGNLLGVVYPNETRAEIVNAFEKNGYWQGEVIYHTKHGDPLNILTTASQIKDNKGSITGNLVIVKDITARKKAEMELSKLNAELELRVKERTKELSESERHYRMLVDQSPDGIFLSDADGNYQEVNKAGCELTRYTAGEILRMTIADMVMPEELKRLPVETGKLQTGKLSLSEWKFRRKDGSVFIGEVIARMLPDGRLQAILRDITERKEIENKIKNLNAALEIQVAKRTQELQAANKEMEAFTYSVSHDLRAPLRGIIGFANILEEDYATQLDDEARRITKVIRDNTLKMGNLIDDLLAFSRTGKQELIKSKVDMNLLVKEIVDEYKSKPPGNIDWQIHELPLVNADANTIRQVWVNLISNAVKYSEKKPQVVIEINSYLNTSEVIFYVKDNGVGFDDQYKNKLFKVFQRLHSSDEFEGTGVGLALVEKIVLKHGGVVWAEGKEGNGACFYFSLPL